MHKHHVIPRHEWKVRFGSLKGFNAPDNIVWLTIAQHAQAHLLLFELNHNEYDLIASQTLSGQIGKEEATRRAHKIRMTGSTPWNKGKTGIYSKDTIEQLRIASLGNIINRGRTHHPESRLHMSLSHRGKKDTIETKLKKSKASSGKPKSPDHIRHMSHRYEITYPDKKTEVIVNLESFCRTQKLDSAAMCHVSKGRQSHHKGFICKRIKEIL